MRIHQKKNVRKLFPMVKEKTNLGVNKKYQYVHHDDGLVTQHHQFDS